MSSKGQIVVPKVLRDAHGWTAGTEFDLVEIDGGVVIQPVLSAEAVSPPITIDEFLASVPKVEGPLLTDGKIERLVLAEAARRFDATRD